MLRIAICCGGGFSSSALANHLEKDVTELGLKKEVEFVFIPFVHLAQRQDEVDVAMLCPHLDWASKQHAKEFHIPICIIAPKLYGLMPARDFIEDAQDIIEIYKKNPVNPTHFEDEPRPLAVTRMTSHRRMLNGEKADLSKILGH